MLERNRFEQNNSTIQSQHIQTNAKNTWNRSHAKRQNTQNYSPMNCLNVCQIAHSIHAYARVAAYPNSENNELTPPFIL